MNWSDIETNIAETINQPFKIQHSQPISGGSINHAYRVSDKQQVFFIKINTCNKLAMFEAEMAGLNEIAASKTIKTAHPVCCGQTDQNSFLVTEYLKLSGDPDYHLLGEQLAAMHQVSQSQYGWFRCNTIGSTPQINTESDDWVDFWRQYRLGFQLGLAMQNGYGGKLQELGEKILADLAVFFSNYKPQASLLHGDLWGGNMSAVADGIPVIYDPAVYFGDRETDIAMTELFGGFNKDFYSSYNNSFPLDEAYAVRKNLYNLYHILNHLNLFGGQYQNQAISIMEYLISETR